MAQEDGGETLQGITRIAIQSDWHDWRTQMAHDLAPAADAIYRQVFKDIGIELAGGIDHVKVTKDEAMARYDWKEGVDVILASVQGCKMTLQEKFLTYKISTVTFEERKTSGVPGAWYYCTAQYYFVGYARIPGRVEFQDYMLLDFPSLRREDGVTQLPWGSNENKRDGRRASFRFLNFADVPSKCIIAHRGF